MSINGCIRKALSKTGLASLAGLFSLAMTHSVVAAPSQVPLFLTAPVKPIMMLNMSNDHQLFFKAYDDYSDLTDPDGGEPDGIADTTYVHKYDYYGYFDSAKCYAYSTTHNRFEPAVAADADKYCGGSHWSGNFLNWATMTRMDAVRKILYGGLRQVDTATETVLERAFLPNDAHSFAKYYNGMDIGKLTPFSTGVPMGLASTAATGITICNTTNPSSRSQYSQTVTDAPNMLVAKGNFSLWASNERWQCRWDINANANDPTKSGIYAYGSSPKFASDKLGAGNYNVRVKVCDSSFDNNANENCRSYGANQKPAGLLQEFGETGSIAFGLLTGSYVKNKSGGVLRKNVGVMTDEINNDGTFKVPTTGSIIKTLDLMRLYGYDFVDGTYNNAIELGGDDCDWATASFVDGLCSNWGNPQAEIFLESLRYLAGLTATAGFLPPATRLESTLISGLGVATWSKPVVNANYCAPLSVLQFNASTSSYDGNSLGGAAGIGLSNATARNAVTDSVGALEGINGKDFFVGQTAADNNQLCTAKKVDKLSEVRGTCSDAPRLEGSYHIAGLAYHARNTGIPIDSVTNKPTQTVRTYGVALAPAVPQVKVPVPGSTGKQITILPACRSTETTPNSNCAIVDFKVIKQETSTVGTETFNNGVLYVNWEDSEQGGDYDQDMWGMIRYKVGAASVEVTTQVMAQSTDHPLGFGYVISGTEDDGFHVHSGVNNFLYGSSCTAATGSRCTCRDSGTNGACGGDHSGSRSKTFTVGTSSATFLEQPLYYAAKWGGYSNELVKEAAEEGTPLTDKIKDRNPDDTYFFATNPRKLEESLRSAFMGVAAEIGTAASAATNSTRLSDGSRFYQALFDSENWTGTLKTMIRNEAGELVEVTTANTDNEFNVTGSIDSGRKVLTYNEGLGALVDFQWENLTPDQKNQLQDGDLDDVLAQKRVPWIRGSRTDESTDGGMRKRKKLLGDIVNSSPVYSGNKAVRYNQLPGAAGASYPAFTKNKVIYVGANDGMLHAFDAENLQEIFAYIPNTVFPKLADFSRPDYGRGANQHQYSVDGPLYVGDAYIDTNDGAGLKWRTILFGTLGAGGKGVFALDVTDPQAPKFLFELDTTDYPELGYVLGTPSIAPLKNGRWAAIFGNGYESSTSQLFVIDLVAPLDPTYSRVINTEGGTGLSAPSLLPNALSQVESVYAGDLQGNLWKFDLSSTTSSDWNRAYGGPMFIAKDGAGNLQPITGGITLGINQVLDGAVMAYFGTGKYFENIDNSAPASPRDSFYAVADTGASLTYSVRSDVLHMKSFTQNAGKRTVVGEKTTIAGVLTSLVDWTSKKGWYMDFDVVNGERVIVKPTLLSDRLVFNTIIPSSVPCNYGGVSWMMELIAVGDKNLAYSILGENANTQMDSMVTSESTVIMGKDEGLVLNCNVKGDCEYVEAVPPGGFSGRTSWRILR